MSRLNPRIYPQYYDGLISRNGDVCLNFKMRLFDNPNCQIKMKPDEKFQLDHFDANEHHNCCKNIGDFCPSCNMVKRDIQARARAFNKTTNYTCQCCGRVYPFPELPDFGLKKLLDYHHRFACLCVCVSKNVNVEMGARNGALAYAPVEPSDDAITESQGQVYGPVRYINDASKRSQEKEEYDRRLETDKSKDTRTSSEVRSDKNWIRYRDYALFITQLGYKLADDDLTSGFANELDIQRGTIRNSYYSRIVSSWSGHLRLDAGNYARNPNKKLEAIEEIQIAEIIKTWITVKNEDDFKQSPAWESLQFLERHFKIDIEILLERIRNAPRFMSMRK